MSGGGGGGGDDGDDVDLEGLNTGVGIAELPLPPTVAEAMAHAGFATATPVQRHAIPPAVRGSDCVVRAKAGTGKTAVIAAVVATKCLRKWRAGRRDADDGVITAAQRATATECHALLLSPTRELAMQTAQVVSEVLMHGNLLATDLRAFVGGRPVADDLAWLAMRSSSPAAVGTPGRLRQLVVDDNAISLSNAALVVFDEADRLLLGGGSENAFTDDIRALLRVVPPAGARQTLAFSATFPQPLLDSLDATTTATAAGGMPLLMHKPQHILLDGGGGASLRRVRQLYVLRTDSDDSAEDGTEWMHANLVDVLTRTPFHQAVIFASNADDAAAATEHLSTHGFPASLLTAQMSQARRTAAMDAARAFEVRCLVCTDVGARGIDLPRVTLVVHLGLPGGVDTAGTPRAASTSASSTYAHRIGRAGRFGARGASVTLLRGGSAELDVLRELLAMSLRGAVQEMDASAMLEAFPSKGALSADAVTSARHRASSEMEARRRLEEAPGEATERHAEALKAADLEGLMSLEEWASAVAHAVENDGVDVVAAKMGLTFEHDDDEEEEEEEEIRMMMRTAEHARHVNPAWVDEFVASFEELRVSLEACASAGAASSQTTVLAPPTSVNDHQGWRNFAAKNEPTTEILAAVREHEAPVLLSCLTEELAVAGDAIDERRAAWVYGVMARLVWPLDAGAASSLRAILRHAARARREHAHDAAVHARAHVLMAAAGVYFKQAGVDENEFRLLY